MTLYCLWTIISLNEGLNLSKYMDRESVGNLRSDFGSVMLNRVVTGGWKYLFWHCDAVTDVTSHTEAFLGFPAWSTCMTLCSFTVSGVVQEPWCG